METGPVAGAGGIAASETVANRPETVVLDTYVVRLRFADGRRCAIAAYPGERDGSEAGWSRYETDCDGVTSLRVDWLPTLPPPPPDPNFPEPPPVVPDYTGALDVIRLPAADLEGASVTVVGPGGVGVFVRWPGRDQ